ncbi:TetR/AcrR family transcriptional regulator [Actinomadura sp. DC4]|uniref:TetR/AcrR family transcriptional regulator n=1 Tax=Actinomadura sp. DC4 TaxID=3055069 RepID=UPI0025B15EFB|nr:TetR/AcrR family transcriptional regulator [Actinomadura sp. DC4]MDN3354825.1 helix-turn-helix domain-containing protein [Actinomadura sp. DC4]
MARSPTDLKERLLVAALRLFVQHGFRGTSLADIAADVGCSKASLLYHFSNKEAILAELLVPVGKEVAVLEARSAMLDGQAAAVATVTGFVDLTLRFRREMKLLFETDATSLSDLPDLGVEDMDGIEHRLVDAMAGRSPEPQDRVAAVMALSGLFVTSAADLPFDDETLRAAMIASALRTLGRTP